MPASRKWWVGTYQSSKHQIVVGSHGLWLQPFTHSEPCAEHYPTQRKHSYGDVQKFDAIAGRIDHDGGLCDGCDVAWGSPRSLGSLGVGRILSVDTADSCGAAVKRALFSTVNKRMGLIRTPRAPDVVAPVSIGSVFGANQTSSTRVHESPDMDFSLLARYVAPSTKQTSQGLVRINFYCHSYSLCRLGWDVSFLLCRIVVKSPSQASGSAGSDRMPPPIVADSSRAAMVSSVRIVFTGHPLLRLSWIAVGFLTGVRRVSWPTLAWVQRGLLEWRCIV